MKKRKNYKKYNGKLSFIDIDNIHRLNLENEYNFRIKLVSCDTIMVDSGIDEWLVVQRDAPRTHFITKHKNRGNDTSHYHLQGIAATIEFALWKIYSHEQKWKNNMKEVIS
jgi:hypothetical protein